MNSKITAALLVVLVATAVAPAQEMDNPNAFMEAFAKAVTADDFAAQSKLLEANKDHIVNGFMIYERAWCKWSTSDQESLQKAAEKTLITLDALASINVIKGQKSRFLASRMPWLQGLTPEQRKAKVEMRALLDAQFDGWNKVMKKGAKPKKEDMEPLAAAYATTVDMALKADDQYWAANNCNLVARVVEKMGDAYGVVYWFKRADAIGQTGHARAEISNWALGPSGAAAAKRSRLDYEHIDVAVPLEKSRAAYTEAVAAAKDKGEKPAGGDPSAPSADAEKDGEGVVPVPADMPAKPNAHPDDADMDWQTVEKLKVAKLKKWPKIDTTYFRANSHWFFWDGVAVQKDQALPVQLLPAGGTVLENEKGKLYVHPGGKGKGKPVRLKLGPKAKVSEFKKADYKDGTKANIWHEMLIQPNRYTIAGHQLGSSADMVTVKFRGATTIKGKVRGVSIEIHDANGNGRFNDFGKDYIITGRGKKATCQPLSKYMTFNGLLYEVEVVPNGRSLRTKPYTGPVAALQLDHTSKLRPAALVAKGTAENNHYFYNLMDCADKPMWVVPGEFDFYEGYIARGKDAKRETIYIARGPDMKWFDVKEDRLNTWKMGGSGERGFHFVAHTSTERKDGKNIIRLVGRNIHIQGNAGERYSFIMTGPVLPTLEVAAGADSTKVAIKKRMRSPERADLNETMDNLWFPKTMELKKSFSSDEYRFKLSCDYKPLGRIESDWIRGNEGK